MSVKNFFIENRETAQLVYGVFLIIIIPLIIIFNTIFIINRYNNSIDAGLQRQALSLGRSVYALLKDDLGSKEKIQGKINDLAETNTDLLEMAILEPAGDDFNVMASTDSVQLNKNINFYFYKIAWTQPDNDGLATDSLKLASNEGGQEFKADKPNQRFWLVAMPMSNASGDKQALLSIKLSSKIVDELTTNNRNISIIFLILTVLIAILFLAATVRLWDYAILYKKIKEIDQMKDEFISIASHELRTPVTGIKGYVSMILEGTLGKISPKIKESLKLVQFSSDRLALLVEDLLNVSRIEQGRFKINPKNLDISSVIQSIINELKVQSDEKGLSLEFQPHNNKLPLIKVDADRLKQVLINLIGNAIKYTEKGKVEIITSEQSKGRVLEIKIKDTGIGMTAEERKRLFEKFYRVQNEKTSEITGTGLGLWITKKIVVLMKGKIFVDSIKEVGTQVTLSFPIVKR